MRTERFSVDKVLVIKRKSLGVKWGRQDIRTANNEAHLAENIEPSFS